MLPLSNSSVTITNLLRSPKIRYIKIKTLKAVSVYQFFYGTRYDTVRGSVATWNLLRQNSREKYTNLFLVPSLNSHLAKGSRVKTHSTSLAALTRSPVQFRKMFLNENFTEKKHRHTLLRSSF